MTRQLIYGALMWAVCGYALLRGGKAERIAAVGIIAMTYLSLLVVSSVTLRFRHMELSVFMVDGSFFVVLLCLSMTTEKYWPLWLTAMQGLTALTHFAPYVPHVIPWAYANAIAMWVYPMLATLAYATWRHHRRKRDEIFFAD